MHKCLPSKQKKLILANQRDVLYTLPHPQPITALRLDYLLCLHVCCVNAAHKTACRAT